jgi:hypothetical protein
VDSSQAFGDLPAKLQKEYLRAFGSERFLSLRAPYESWRAAAHPEDFEERLLDPLQQPLVLSTAFMDSGLLPGPFAPRTIELRTGHLLHSNGPLLEIEPFIRMKGEPQVTSNVRVSPAEDAGVFEVLTREKVLFSECVDKVRRIKLSLEVDSNERILLRLVASPRIGSMRGIYAGRAWLAVTVP